VQNIIKPDGPSRGLCIERIYAKTFENEHIIAYTSNFLGTLCEGDFQIHARSPHTDLEEEHFMYYIGPQQIEDTDVVCVLSLTQCVKEPAQHGILNQYYVGVLFFVDTLYLQQTDIDSAYEDSNQTTEEIDKNIKQKLIYLVQYNIKRFGLYAGGFAFYSGQLFDKEIEFPNGPKTLITVNQPLSEPRVLTISLQDDLNVIVCFIE
jgi:hypothetical protein